MRIIAIVGMPGSGKSVLSHHLTTKGYPSIRFGGIIIDELKKRGMEINPVNERIVREEIRGTYGMDACAKIALPLIKDKLSQHRLVVIDGLYSFSEYKTLSNEFDEGLILVAVFTPKRIRYQRLAYRVDRPLTNSEAVERDLLEIERLEKGGPIALADFTLINDGSPEELIEKADELLESLLKEEKV